MSWARDSYQSAMLEKVGPYLIEKFGSVETCLSVSLVVQNALRTLGVEAQARTCEVLFCNQKYRRHLDEVGLAEIEKLVQTQSLPPDEWCIGIGVDVPGDANPLHAIVYLPEFDEIIDLTAHQASRPERQLVIPPFWIGTDDVPSFLLRLEFKDLKANPKILDMSEKEQLQLLADTVHLLMGGEI